MPQPNDPRGGRGRPRIEPDACPLPLAAANQYRQFRPGADLLHPHYALLKMVRWHEGWQRDAPRGADANSPSVKRFNYTAAKVCLNASALQEEAKRVLDRRRAWIVPFEATGCARTLHLVAETDFVIHLSSRGPLELGLALHHLYGFPVLPATSLKGLARASSGHGADELYGQQGHVSALDVLDGLPVSWKIQADVMTPHFSKWYQQDRAPDDTEDPSPLPFLSLAPGTVFEVAVVVRHGTANAAEWLDRIEEDLRQGIDERGLGAKTSAGYGMFTVKRVEPQTPRAQVTSATGGPDTRVSVTAAAPAETRRAPSAFDSRMGELRAVKAGNVGALSGLVQWFGTLTVEAERREAATLLIGKADRAWAKRKAKEDERWRAILEAAQ